MLAPALAQRLDRVVSAIQRDNMDALFLSTPGSMGYFQGLFEDGHERFMLLAIRANGDVAFICPALTANQARRHGIQDIRSWADGVAPLDLFDQLAQDWDLRTAVIGVDAPMRADQLLQMQDRLPAALFKDGSGTIARVKRNKDEAEIAALLAAGALADEVSNELHHHIRAGQTERELAGWIMGRFLAKGGSSPWAIVASGPGGAEPHHLNEERTMESGDVVILDFGCSLDHYQSDITRTVALDRASDEAKLVYQTVNAAHHASRLAVRPGASTGSVDEAGRKVIRDAGFGEYFVHRTGHGIGIMGHEDPYIAPGSELILEAGDCFSIEPGIYLPGKLGVRLENIVACGVAGNDVVSLNAEFSNELVVV